MAHSNILTSTRFRTFSPAAQLLTGLGLAFVVALAAIGPERLVAQIEGERGIAPLASSTDIQVGGIEVNTTGKTAEEARAAGWKAAQRKAWESMKGPAMSDGQIDAMVSAVVIEREQIGPRRYVARLGVIFDRAKAGQYIAQAQGGGARARSAPLLVMPILDSAGVSQVFEVRGAWQRAWANFQTAASPIDYVRPVGAGGESLMINAGQAGRRSRLWWRTVLDQTGASDVIMPVARLEHEWPGGPIKGTFTARYGPDNTYIDSFTLTAKDDSATPQMLNQALVRLDQIYAGALAQGLLRPDPTLVADQSALFSVLAQIKAQTDAAAAALAPEPSATPTPAASPSPGATPSPSAASSQAASATYTVQFASPDARAVDAALAAVRAAPGVRGAATTSIAIGGTSVMRVTMAGDIDALAAALRARGWQVSGGGAALSIRR